MVCDAAFRIATHIRLALPVFASDAICAYTPTTTKPLRLLYARTGQIQTRCDEIRLALIIREAGCHCSAEQSIDLQATQRSSTEQADLVALSLGGCRCALDVTVTHGAVTATCSATLLAAENDKCRQYRVQTRASILPGGEKFYPLVHHRTGMLGAAALDFAHLLLQDLTAKAITSECLPWSTAIGRAKERVFQALTFATMRGTHRVYRACALTL
eukprot:6061651-Amphidinium_carterae.1